MRIIFLFALSILAITLASCTKTSEDKLKDAFKEYANKNLDDPSSLEILSIDSVDTISTRKCIDELLKDSADLSNQNEDEVQSIMKMTQSLYKIPANKRLKMHEDPTVAKLFGELMSAAEINSQKAKMGLIYDFQGCLDRLKAHKDTCVCETKFKIRMNKKVYNYVAYSDTTFSKFDFFLEENAIKECDLSKFFIDYLEFKAHELEKLKYKEECYKKRSLLMKRIEELAGMKVFDY